MNLMKQLEEIQKKAGHYEAIAGRAQEAAEALEKARDDYHNAMKEASKEFFRATEAVLDSIDPARQLRRRNGSGSSRMDYAEILENLYNKLQAGTRIDVALINATYPELEKNHVLYVLKQLEAMPGIEKTKKQEDQRQVVLYHRGAP